MYTVDDKDTVVEIDTPPRPNAGAPLPMVFATDNGVVLAYVVSEPDPYWDGGYSNMVSATSEAELIALVKFEIPSAHMMGPPNDETFSGHPLYDRGLKPYSISEIKHSSWIRSLQKMNSVHPMHQPEAFGSRRHFIFAFHDCTFECVARGFTCDTFRGSLRSTVDRLAVLLLD